MPWRLIGTVIVLVLVIVFIGFNLGNACDIALGFTTLTAVPVYLTALSAFAAGIVVSLPLVLGGRRGRGSSRGGQKAQKPQKSGGADRKKDGLQGGSPKAGDETLDASSYGVD